MKSDDEQQHDEEVKRQQNNAADLVRSKLDKLYASEPDAEQEISEVKAHKPDEKLSKHQMYMKELSSSGRNLAEIQTAWHEYYASLSDSEKQEVWQEFYSEHKKLKEEKVSKSEKNDPDKQDLPAAKKPEPARPVIPTSHNTAAHKKSAKRKKQNSDSTVGDIKQHLLGQIQSRTELHKNPHARALTFGLTMGALTLIVLLFGFFNERFITPFIRPNANVSATPIIVDPNASGPVGPEPKIIIPKINVEAPVVYDVQSIAEKDVQKGLENGVVHYVTTPNPGEKGNAVIFGHSSSNILNKGKYKFAFLMLKSLDKDDTFIIQKDGKRYVYKVYNEFVTAPDDFSVLGPTDKTATLTLITCDPPGTSTNRLIVQAEQIFPDPKTNPDSKTANQNPTGEQARQLPANSPTLWSRITSWL